MLTIIWPTSTYCILDKSDNFTYTFHSIIVEGLLYETMNSPINTKSEVPRLCLVQELQGILNWAIKGCRDWHEQGSISPQVVLELMFLEPK